MIHIYYKVKQTCIYPVLQTQCYWEFRQTLTTTNIPASDLCKGTLLIQILILLHVSHNLLSTQMQRFMQQTQIRRKKCSVLLKC